MSWRYQPIYVEDENGDRVYSLLEVYFDDDGNFENWTETLAIPPVGDTWEELADDLHRMLVDAMCWEPVDATEMKPGMQFEPRVSMDERLRLVEFIAELTTKLRTAPRPKLH